MKSLISAFAIAFLIIACQKNEVANSTAAASANATAATTSYSISGSKIKLNGSAVQLVGANAFHTFGAGGSDMKSWKMDIAREFVGNVKENPLSGWAIQDATGSYLHSLQEVVDSNRLSKRVTILCPFRWNGNDSTLFTGTRPMLTSWYANLKIKLAQWAVQFKNQPDVWIEVWNEPYRYDRVDGYTDAIWMSDMNDLVATIRNAGNNNIILVPCAEQGQDESVLNNVGATFLSGKSNILFDVHAYEKWLLVSNANIDARLQTLKTNNLPVIFGETAPMNAGVLMNPSYFLNNIYGRGLSVTAWVWKYNAADQDALLTASGLPNNTNNNNWGTTFKTLAAKVRTP